MPINAAKTTDSKAKPGTAADTEYLYPGIPVTRATSDVFVIRTNKVLYFIKPVQVWILLVATKSPDEYRYGPELGSLSGGRKQVLDNYRERQGRFDPSPIFVQTFLTKFHENQPQARVRTHKERAKDWWL